MRIVRIHVTNFLSHRDTELSLDGFDAVIAVGPNGTGKSSLMVDSMLVALFGKGRSGDLDGYISNGKDMMIAEVDFSIADNRYRVVRKRSKKTARGSSSLEFSEIDSSSNEIRQLTAGSIAETEEIIERTLGIDFDTLVRSSVLEQGEADFFCRATPAERMGLFSKIWDLERYDAMAQIARETYGGLKMRIASIEEKIQGAQQRISEIKEMEGELEATRKELKPLAATILSLNEKRDKLQKQIGAFENVSKEIEKAKEYKDKAEQEIKRLSDQHAQVMAKIERFDKILRNQDTVRAKLAEEETANADIARAEASLRAIGEQVEGLRKGIERIREEYQKKLDEAEAALSRVDADIGELRTKETALEKVSAELGRKREELKHLRTDAEKLKGIACHPDFDPSYVNEACRFIKDAIEAKRRIPELEEDCNAIATTISTEKDALTTQMRLNEEKRTACLSTIGDIKKSLNEAVGLKQAGVNEAESNQKSQRAEIEALKASLIEIQRYTKLFPEIDLAEKELPGLKDEERSIAERSNEQVAQRDRQGREIEKLTEKLGGRGKLEEDCKSVVAKIEEVLAKRDDLTKRIGFVEAEIARAEALKAEIREDEKAIETLSGDQAIYQLLEDAFKQIPYMLVSRGIGAVESIANEILSMISSHGLSVRIETEKMTKTTKKIKDEINLRIQDSDGEKEYKFLSGGEKLRVAMALRLAISEVLAHRRGMRIDSLIADEPFGALDTEGIEDMKEAMRELKKRFRFMGIITHIEASKDIFPTQLVFSKDASGSKVEIQEEYA